MSGIGNYFHGEQGQVVDLSWSIYDDSLVYIMWLQDEPHRRYALDYNSDISIDPQIAPGDRVVYIYLGIYAGIWVRQGSKFSPDLERALERTHQHRSYFDEFNRIKPDSRLSWLKTLSEKTGIPVLPEDDSTQFTDNPLTDITLFLSYSSANALIARKYYDLIRKDGKVDIWFDIAQAGEAPDHDKRIEEWLGRGVGDCKGFLLLLTKASASSEWVGKEIEMAMQKAYNNSNFNFLVLKMDEVTLPQQLQSTDFILDCWGLSPGNIEEELYAVIYQRQGRREWLEIQKERGWHEEENLFEGYDHLRSDGGETLKVGWKKKGWDIQWHLTYKRGDKVAKVEGSETNQVLDLDIRRGDLVGYFQHGNKTIWMRSGDMDVKPDDIFLKYQNKLKSPPLSAWISSIILALLGFMVIGLACVGFSHLMQKMDSENLPFEISAQLLALTIVCVKFIFLATVLTYGLAQLTNVSHPCQFRNRSGFSKLTYFGTGLSMVFWSSTFHPFVHYFIVSLSYLLPMAIASVILREIFGVNWSPALVIGYLIVYGFTFIYVLIRGVKLVRKGPVYISEPEYNWLP